MIITKRRLKKTLEILLVAFAVISFWRGVWGLMDLYLFPNNHIISFTISIIVGLVILYTTESVFDKLI